MGAAGATDAEHRHPERVYQRDCGGRGAAGGLQRAPGEPSAGPLADAAGAIGLRHAGDCDRGGLAVRAGICRSVIERCAESDSWPVQRPAAVGNPVRGGLWLRGALFRSGLYPAGSRIPQNSPQFRGCGPHLGRDPAPHSQSDPFAAAAGQRIERRAAGVR